MTTTTEPATTQSLLGQARDTVVCFPEGLPGLDHARCWQFMEREDARPFVWLRAVDRPGLCLLAVEARSVWPAYDPELSRSELSRVMLSAAEPRLLLAVVTLRPDGATANLRAPLLVNPDRLLGAQVILEDARWPLSQELVVESVEPAETVCGDKEVPECWSSAEKPARR